MQDTGSQRYAPCKAVSASQITTKSQEMKEGSNCKNKQTRVTEVFGHN